MHAQLLYTSDQSQALAARDRPSCKHPQYQRAAFYIHQYIGEYTSSSGLTDSWAGASTR